jgi:NADH-quinone oxidoreductase subunit G
MPKLIIDTIALEVSRGTKVIEAAEQAGIIIPRFCFHPALGSLGACRMCAVKFLEGPVKGIKMSCMEQARDGMVVSTTDAEVVDFRRQVIEWLMLNHPHDCPVCDEGGHCLLQDLTVAGGQGLRRFFNPKRTYEDQNLGALIQHEMNRCIHCYRCLRFYQEFAGYRDFGALGIGDRTYLGRFHNGPLESPFSGNIIDLCPTGVLTDKPSRFKGRRWDFERGHSVCLHCSLGCRVLASVRYREPLRLEAAFSPFVNGYFICDRGRHGFYYAHHPQRPRQARIGKNAVPFNQALQAAAERLSQISHLFGKEVVACQGSSRSALETQALLKGLCRKQGWLEPGYGIDPIKEKTVLKAVSRLEAGLAVSLKEIEQADLVLLVGADPINEAPMLALALRQASRKGAPIIVMDPRPIVLPMTFDHLSVGPGDLDLCLKVIFKKAVSLSDLAKLGPKAQRFYESLPEEFILDPLIQDRLTDLAGLLSNSHQPVIVCGTDLVRETLPDLAADLVHSLQAQGKSAGLFYLLPEGNSFGAALLSFPNRSFLKTVEAIENGSISALMLIETDPFHFFPDRTRLEQALDKLDFLLVLDYLPSQAVERADIFLPTQTIFEAGGHFINQEGRLQWAGPVFNGGFPLEQLSRGGPPPRLFGPDIPGGESKPAHQILNELAQSLSPESHLSLTTLWPELAKEIPVFSLLEDLPAPSQGIRILPGESMGNYFTIPGSTDQLPVQADQDSVELLLVDRTFGTEELSSYAGPLSAVTPKPGLLLSTGLAAQLGLLNGDLVTLSLDNGPVSAEIDLDDRLAPGVMILPRHAHLDWQKITTHPIRVTMDQINKTQEPL